MWWSNYVDCHEVNGACGACNACTGTPGGLIWQDDEREAILADLLKRFPAPSNTGT